ncbi:MAG: type II/IV secretion system protein [Candidatus Wildermuthbacteria bacterium]|nr:type II/IV secretion system protein [Candidatus Wildermuthbacteria bacterium]
MGILQSLVQKHLIDEAKAALIEKESLSSGKSPEELVLSQKLIDEALLFGVKSAQLNIPLRQVNAKDVPAAIVRLIPEDSARYYKLVPIAKQENTLEVGMVYPEDIRAQEALKFLARQGSFSYRISLIALSVFEALMRQYQPARGDMGKALEELGKVIQETTTAGRKGTVEFSRVVEEAPVTKMVAVILRNAVEGNASDIHIEPTKENLRVRFRFLGELHASLTLPSEAHQAVVARIKILANMKIDETRLPQDGRFSAPIDGRNIDFRVATLPTSLGEKVEIRVLDPTTGLKTFEELGLEDRNLMIVKEAVKKPYGLILVTGPTGSGKTTTLYGILNYLNSEAMNIVSIEDPVEYFVPGINQSQVRPELGYDFASGLRQILRQDPNVIMVGEVRDQETASLIIHAALTGHIVLSTLHTNNAIGVIPRLLNMGVEPYLIPPTLSVVVSQRLVRRLCDECKQKTEAPKPIRDLVMKEINDASADFKKRVERRGEETDKEMRVFQAKGCRQCASTGFTGRIALFEILKMTDELARLVTHEPSEAKIRAEAKRQGMITMRQDGVLKALDGVTTIEEVFRVTAEAGEE